MTEKVGTNSGIEMKFILALIFLTLTSVIVHADEFYDNYSKLTPTPIMGFVIPQKLDHETLKMFYNQSIIEYKNANYGLAKELLEATVQRTDAFPKAYFYLGVIYGEEHLPFHNEKIAKKHYENCIAHRKSDGRLKQICYEKMILECKLTNEQVSACLDASRKISEQSYYYKDTLAISKWVNDKSKIFDDETRKLDDEAFVMRNNNVPITQNAVYLVGY